jgi:hypothetical protein
VIGALTLFYSILTVALLVPLLAGLYSTATRPAAAKGAILVAILVLVGTHFTVGESVPSWLPVGLAVLAALATLELMRWVLGPAPAPAGPT